MGARAARKTSSKSASPPAARKPSRWIVAIGLALFAAIAYAPAIGVPFIGDDYVFLDKTRAASFLDLWSFRNTDFDWYRPWSRELHFWALQHVVGPHEPGFRIVSLLLWLASLLLFFDLTRRMGSPRIATVAALGVASLSLWGAPLMWISGAQDLWMLAFVLLTLGLAQRGRWGWSWLAYILALLSKETAVATPVIMFAQLREIHRESPRTAIRLATPFVLLTIVWITLHPTLRDRLMHRIDPATTGETIHSPLAVVTNSVLSMANSDKLLLPRERAAERPLATVTSALALAAAAWLALGRAPGAREPTGPANRDSLARFGVIWCVVGWVPLLLPSIGWHAYYGSLGAFGAWLAIASQLERWPRIASVVLLALGLLRAAAAATRSWDWGSEWYQSRAGNMLRVIRGQLLRLHPTLPKHTRLFFGNIPNNIGLVAGKSPAVRVWYDDPTLEGGFYSHYRERAPGKPQAPDLFFSFDSTSGIHEVLADGRPDPRTGRRDAQWEEDSGGLAMTFVTNGDFLRAAKLFDVMGQLPHRTDAAMFAAICREAAGDSASAARGFAAVQARTGGTRQQVEDWAARLRASMPRRSAGPP